MSSRPESAAASAPSTTEVPTAPPVARREPTEKRIHDQVRLDDYEWLRRKEDPEVRAYLDAENAWTQAQTAHLGGLRTAIFDEIKAHTQETDLSVPSRNRGYWYYSRSFEGKEYGASCRVPVRDADDWTPPTPDRDAGVDVPALPGEELLLDLNDLAEGHEFFSLGGSSISVDTTLLAYGTDVVGDERYTVRFKDLTTGELLKDELVDVRPGVVWAPDGTEVYYVTVDESWRPDTVWRHRMGTSQADDVQLYHEPDERFFVGAGRSKTDRFVIIVSGSKTTSEYHVLDTEDPDAGFVCFAPRVEGLEYHLEHAEIGGEDCWLVLHNGTGPDFEIGRAPLAPTPPDQWRPLIPYDPEVRLEDVSAHRGYLVISQRSQGLTQARIVLLGDGPDSDDGITDDYLVEFDREVYTIGASGSAMFEAPMVRIGYTTMAVPPSVYDYDVRTRELTLLRSTPVQPGPDGTPYDPEQYEEHRLWATAPDGEQVPISLVCRVDARGDGQPLPILLYGYGAYEASMDPYFSIARLSLLDRGAGFAIAHIRGGGEMGRRWYDGGKMEHKQNTFSDFIASAGHLVDTGWTEPGRLIAEGASAGGLLIGAVANQAPELFAGFVAGVPFVDALTTMLDASLPLTVTEYDEWGNPEGSPEVYATMAAYAPYDNVAAVDYPPILAETSLNDTRVLYVEPAKWVAKLRATATGRRDFLLRTEMAAGHGGVSGRYKAWQDRAFTLAWILDRMGLADRSV